MAIILVDKKSQTFKCTNCGNVWHYSVIVEEHGVTYEYREVDGKDILHYWCPECKHTVTRIGE